MAVILHFDPLVQRLESRLPDYRGAVLFAADQAGAIREAETLMASTQRNTSICLIAPMEQCAPSESMAVVKQQPAVRLGLYCSTYRPDYDTGTAAYSAVESLRQAAVGALLGFKPWTGVDVIQYRAGLYRATEDGWLGWFGELTTTYNIIGSGA